MKRFSQSMLKNSHNVQAMLKVGFQDTLERVKWSKINSFINNDNSPAFEEVAFKTPVGSMSDVIQSANGYHILLVIETK